MADNGTSSEVQAPATFTSKLAQGKQRFLAHVIEHAFSVGRRTPEDFIRHFPPHSIMNGLEREPTLRARILGATTGLNEKIGAKKGWQSAAEDVQIALDEGVTNAATVVEAFHPDDRVRYLDNQKLWGFLIEGEFWQAAPKHKEKYAEARLHIAFMLERALADSLVTHRDVVEGISVAQLALCLPKAELGKIIESALDNSHRGQPFTELDLLTARPPSVLVEYVPLSHIYDTVIAPKIAQTHGYVSAAAPEPEPQPEPTPLPESVLDEAAAAEAGGDTGAKGQGGEDWVDVGEKSEDVLSEEDFASA
jgi:hypothetical protein